ncbi:GntR family transcriptional regulator [Paenibacillus glycanilyticus]|uniref:GntR family transcriptional regulator n=1 Tax=Paenibacillus glycanilyticus TaxID=126569 RepID=UPI002040E0CC|nr:GntR family transcriptional regulator [Paenibacillus glycanilyticus]MCM3628239.1 GntR family transcriptional regulator [Paenibacillus glycanilyticus]
MKKSLNRYVLTEEIYALLKGHILNHDIAPGEKVNIDQLARDLEVSNIPIREALSRLAAEGLVDTVPFKGMFVAKMSLQELDEMFEIRMELECLSIRKAARLIPASELEQLKKAMEEYPRSDMESGEQRIQVIAEMNQGLHGLILNHCGNHSLRNLIETYIEKIQRYLALYQKDLKPQLIQVEWEEHMRIVQFLVARDEQSAEQALKQHLENSYKRTRAFFV